MKLFCWKLNISEPEDIVFMLLVAEWRLNVQNFVAIHLWIHQRKKKPLTQSTLHFSWPNFFSIWRFVRPSFHFNIIKSSLRWMTENSVDTASLVKCLFIMYTYWYAIDYIVSLWYCWYLVFSVSNFSWWAKLPREICFMFFSDRLFYMWNWGVQTSPLIWFYDDEIF